MKAVSGNPHPKPERNPDNVFVVGETTLSVYFNAHSVEVFQEQKGHTQRLQLTKEQWRSFSQMLPK